MKPGRWVMAALPETVSETTSRGPTVNPAVLMAWVWASAV